MLILRNNGFHVLPQSLFKLRWICRILLLSVNCLFLAIPLFYVRVFWAILQAFLGAAN